MTDDDDNNDNDIIRVIMRSGSLLPDFKSSMLFHFRNYCMNFDM